MEEWLGESFGSRGDGAAWIWNLADEHFYDSHQAVDWYQATEHLAKEAQLPQGEGEPSAKLFRRKRTPLFGGMLPGLPILEGARDRPNVAKGLEKEAGYFRNRRRMN